ncbi:MAG: choice-of-anchor B family protein [Gemmatimonadetes bacterium]|nr:choice-of-anchor B family protein [Gemmatimonadota bacterium]
MKSERTRGWIPVLAAMLTIAAAPPAGLRPGPVLDLARLRALDGFGAAVAVGPDEVFVGESQNGGEPGYVYVYRRAANGGWSQYRRLTASDAAAGDGFGHALVVEGDRLLVGAVRQPHGAAYLFERGTDGEWRESARFQNDGAPDKPSLFGFAIGISGDVVAVGAPLADQIGSVFVYQRDAAGTWRPAARIRPADAVEEAFFGVSIGLDGQDLIVGSIRSGMYAFRGEAGEWRETGKLALPGERPGGGPPRAITVRAGRAFTGDPAGGNGAGAVHVFRRDETGVWSVAGIIVPTDSTTGQAFGSALAVDGSTIWIASLGAGDRRGEVSVFDGTGDAWRLRARIAPAELVADDAFGGSIAVRGGVAAIGLIGADYGAGKAMIFQSSTGQEWLAAATVFTEMKGLDAVTGNAITCTDGKAGEFACGSVELLSFLPISAIGGGRGVRLNDIWGWTDPVTAREYALVGRNDGAAFVDVTDPVRPVHVGQLLRTTGSPASSWRDIKVYRDHAYIVSDAAGEHGMQVFDLTRLRSFSGMPIEFSPDTTYHGIASAHNIVVNEESGFAYPVGSGMGGETCGGGLHMIDIRDPEKPVFAGCFADPETGNAGTGYSHDAQCVIYHGPDEQYRGREICVGSNETAISIADVTDKAAPKAISRASYPNAAYTHQGWFTEDHRYFFVDDEGDEVSGTVQRTRTLVWDMTDLDDPVLVREHLGETAASDHNLYIRGNLMYQSNYASGLRILDITNPLEPKEVGYLDTNPFGENTPGFTGSWSNYPFFNSGVIAVTSIEFGLYLVRYRSSRPIS